MQTLIDLDSSSGKNYYTNPSKNRLPVNYPQLTTITLPDTYPKIARNNYWIDGHFTNYPSLWSINVINQSTFDMTPALGPFVARLAVLTEGANIGGYKIVVNDITGKDLKTLYLSKNTFNPSNKYDITGLTPCTQYIIEIHSTDVDPTTVANKATLNLSKPTYINIRTPAEQRIYKVQSSNNAYITTLSATSSQPFNNSVRPQVTKNNFNSGRALYYDIGNTKDYVVGDPIKFSWSNFFVTNPSIIKDPFNPTKYATIPANSIFYNVDTTPTNTISVHPTYKVILPLSQNIGNTIILAQTGDSNFNQTTISYKFRPSSVPINAICPALAPVPAPVPAPAQAPLPAPYPAPEPATAVPDVPSDVFLEKDGTAAPYNILIKFPTAIPNTIKGFRLSYGSYTDDIKVSDLLSYGGAGKYHTLQGTYGENATVRVDIYATTDITPPYTDSPKSTKKTISITVITIKEPKLAINYVGGRAMLLESTETNPNELKGYKISGGPSNIYVKDSDLTSGFILSNFNPNTSYNLQIYGTVDTTPDANSLYGTPQYITKSTEVEHRIATVSGLSATNTNSGFAYFYSGKTTTIPVYIDLNSIKNSFVYNKPIPLTTDLAKQLFVINPAHAAIGTAWYNTNTSIPLNQIKVLYSNITPSIKGNGQTYPLTLNNSINTITITNTRPSNTANLTASLKPTIGSTGTPAYGGSSKSKRKTLRKSRYGKEEDT